MKKQSANLPDLGDIAAFVRVVESHGFSAAARTLGVSKSASSKAVTRLEERLGARLLNRTTRQLSLTEEGSAYYAHSARILAEIEDAERVVSERHGQPRGHLKVSSSLAF